MASPKCCLFSRFCGLYTKNEITSDSWIIISKLLNTPGCIFQSTILAVYSSHRLGKSLVRRTAKCSQGYFSLVQSDHKCGEHGMHPVPIQRRRNVCKLQCGAVPMLVPQVRGQPAWSHLEQPAKGTQCWPKAGGRGSIHVSAASVHPHGCMFRCRKSVLCLYCTHLAAKSIGKSWLPGLGISRENQH